MAKGTLADPIEAIYVTEVTVTDPDSKQPVDLEVWKDPQSGGLLAVDASFVERVEGIILSPFNRGTVLHLSERAVEARHEQNIAEVAQG